MQSRLQGIKPLEIAIPFGLGEVSVNRVIMKESYGCHIRPMYIRLENIKHRVGNQNYRHFMYPTIAVNPNLPREPGMPGLLCRVYKKREWANEPHKLLVGFEAANYRYLGDYVLDRGPRVSCQDFKAFSADVSYPLLVRHEASTK